MKLYLPHLRRLLLILTVSIFSLGAIFSSRAQDFQISQDVSGTLSSGSSFTKVFGYAPFTPLMTMEVELLTNDTSQTVVYSEEKDFSVGGLSTLTNFSYDSVTGQFGLDIDTYDNLNYRIRIVSMESGEIKEELFIDTF